MQTTDGGTQKQKTIREQVEETKGGIETFIKNRSPEEQEMIPQIIEL